MLLWCTVMGRVSKHKKIKSCDPFYKGPRVNPVRYTFGGGGGGGGQFVGMYLLCQPETVKNPCTPTFLCDMHLRM